MIITCAYEHCGNLFLRENPRRMYCSGPCKLMASRTSRRPADHVRLETCAEESCHNLYVARGRYIKRYCSHACRATPPPERRAVQRRQSHVWRTYGLDKQSYEAMQVAQDDRCASCGEKQVGRRLAVDHDHACCPGKTSCGKCVRALVCQACNSAAGLLKDDPDRALALATYLLRYHRQKLKAVS